jgi:hypothetical protein
MSADPKREPGRTEPYVTILERNPKRWARFEACYSGLSLYAATSLYMEAGRYMPDLAKRKGVFLGPCNAEGFRVDATQATHIGLTAGDDTEMELPCPLN